MTEEFVRRVRGDVERRLSELTAHASHGPAAARVLDAVRYALLGAGKRFRPLLVIASGEACPSFATAGPEVAGRLLTTACAIEMIHTFSLVHDDLPALDDDALRRGRPTLHVAFGEGIAILAGDALLNLAYQVLASTNGDPAARLRVLAVVGEAVGLGGMIAGQVMDITSEHAAVDAETLHQIHALKTGALITACCEAGGLVAGADAATLDRLRAYGSRIGLAFQIVDDILDVEGSARDLGKSPGKDASAGKATFPAMWGLEESRRRAARCVEEARAAVEGLAGRHLHDLAAAVLTRKG